VKVFVEILYLGIRSLRRLCEPESGSDGVYDHENEPRTLFALQLPCVGYHCGGFSVSGDIVDALSKDFHLTKMQVGVILGPVFWGEMLAMLLAGSLLDFTGMRKLLGLASVGYIAAVFLVIFAPKPEAAVDPYYTDPGFLFLFGGMILMGLSRASWMRSSARSSPRCTRRRRRRRLNKLHAGGRRNHRGGLAALRRDQHHGA